MVVRVELPAAHRSALEGEGQALDVMTLAQDVEPRAADVEHRGHVLVHQALGQLDARVHHAQHPVRSDEADELDLPAPRRSRRDAVRRIEQPRPEAEAPRDLVGVAPWSAE